MESNAKARIFDEMLQGVRAGEKSALNEFITTYLGMSYKISLNILKEGNINITDFDVADLAEDALKYLILAVRTRKEIGDPQNIQSLLAVFVTKALQHKLKGDSEPSLNEWSVASDRMNKDVENTLKLIHYDSNDTETLVSDERATLDEFRLAWKAATQEMVASFPPEYEELSREVAAATSDFRQATVARLLPALKDEMKARPHDTYNQKVELVRWVNAELRRFDLAIKHPKTGQPAVLNPSPGNHPEIGSFELATKDAEGRRKTFTTPDLDTLLDKLELMDASRPPGGFVRMAGNGWAATPRGQAELRAFPGEKNQRG